jgi:hypothetical protein
VAVGGQLPTVVPPIAEHSPLAAQRHDPPLVLAVVQHTVPEHVARLPLAYIVQSQSPALAPDSHLITSHWHEPSTLTYMSLHEIPPPPEQLPPEEAAHRPISRQLLSRALGLVAELGVDGPEQPEVGLASLRVVPRGCHAQTESDQIGGLESVGLRLEKGVGVIGVQPNRGGDST